MGENKTVRPIIMLGVFQCKRNWIEHTPRFANKALEQVMMHVNVSCYPLFAVVVVGFIIVIRYEKSITSVW